MGEPRTDPQITVWDFRGALPQIPVKPVTHDEQDSLTSTSVITKERNTRPDKRHKKRLHSQDRKRARCHSVPPKIDPLFELLTTPPMCPPENPTQFDCLHDL